MSTDASSPTEIPSDYPARIRQFRTRLGLTQSELAGRLGVSFATVNRWENGQTKPSRLAWSRILKFDSNDAPITSSSSHSDETPPTDFTSSPEVVRALVEGERLSFGHLANPTFATEISSIDPLPHQRIAVYDHMLKHGRLRFLRQRRYAGGGTRLRAATGRDGRALRSSRLR
jgi:transcriptional regulator with XRE-family HTH domain